MFHNVAFKNIFKRTKQYRRQRYGFYECGFRPRQELAIEFDMQNYIIFSMTLLYDAEGIIFLLFCQCLNIFCLTDAIFILTYFALFILGFVVDIKQRGAF